MKAFRRASRPGRLAQTIAVALAAIANSATAEVVDIAWSATGRFEYRLSVAPGKFAEVCGRLPAGLKVNWNFEASAPLDFNVHYHVTNEVVFPSKLTAVTVAKDTLHTRVEQDYCWMWTNKSTAPTTFTIWLQR